MFQQKRWQRFQKLFTTMRSVKISFTSTILQRLIVCHCS
jgi:hypothetical protein